MIGPTTPSPEWARLETLESDVDEHDHFALVYRSREEQHHVALPFVARGLERGERVVYSVGDNSPSDVCEALAERGVDAAHAVETGALTFHDVRDVYLHDGAFDAERMADRVLEEADSALASGYAGLRITAEVTGPFLEAVDIEEFLEYERLVDELIDGEGVLGLCQYDLESVDSAVVDDVVQTHPVLGCNREIGTNSYYVPPEEYTPRSPLSVDQKLRAHADKVERDRRRRRRDRGLAALTRGVGELSEADRSAIPRVAADTVRETTNCDVAALLTHVDDALRVDAVASSDRVSAAADAVDANRELAWEAFVANVARDERRPADGASELCSVAALPIEGTGVLFLGSVDAADLSSAERNLARIVGGTVRIVVDHHRRAEELDDHRERAARQRTVVNLLRAVGQACLDATAREELERCLCSSVTDLEDVAFAWIGSVDLREERIVPREWAGPERGFLSDVTEAASGAGPAIETARSGDVATVPSIAEHAGADVWRRAALERGFSAAASVPIQYEGVSFGVFTMYVDREGSFEALPDGTLLEVGNLAGHVVNALEQENVLHSDRTRQFEFRIEDGAFPLLQIARRAGCEVTFEDFVLESATELLTLARAPATSGVRLAEAADAAAGVRGVDLVHEGEDASLLKLSLVDPFVGKPLSQRDVAVERIAADPDGVRIAVSSPSSIDGTAIAESFEPASVEPDLIASRGTPRPTSPPTVPADALERLTDRQQEVATVAYHAGYFETPRDCSGSEVADALDISPQAFYQHVRRIEGELFGWLLDGHEGAE